MVAKGVALFTSGAITWITSQFVAMMNPPDSAWMIWLDKYGFPTVVSILLLGGIMFIFQAYRSARDETSKVQEDRIKDRDIAIAQYRVDFTEAQSSRIELVSSQKETVAVLSQVREELQKMQGFRINRKSQKSTMPESSSPNESPN